MKISFFFLLGKPQPESISSVPWVSSEFYIINKTNNVVCCKTNHDPIVLIDLQVNKKIQEVDYPMKCKQHNLATLQNFEDSSEVNCHNNCDIKCLPLTENTISILNSKTGDLSIYDFRSEKCFVNINNETKEANIVENWTMSKSDDKNSFPNHFGILSNTESFSIFDKRTNSSMFQNRGELHKPKKSVDNLKLKFCEKEDKFSISGLNAFVKVFRMTNNNNNNNYKHVFTHNGHSPGDEFLPTVTDHIWLNTGHQELIISICDNKTLNCWNHNEKLEII